MKNCTNVQKMLQNYMTCGGGENGGCVHGKPKNRGPGSRTTKHLHIKYDNVGPKCYI